MDRKLESANSGTLTPFYALSGEAALDRLLSSRGGLKEEEALSRLEKFGPNRLPAPKGKSLAKIFLSQFASPFIYLLLAAGALSLALAHMADAIFIFAVLVANALIGTYQEWRAENRAQSLRALIKTSASVLRDGRLVRISGDSLVPGDVVQVESGAKVAADLRLIGSRNLSVDESLLTGESEAVQKVEEADLPDDSPLSAQITMLFAGTMVRSGRGVGVVAGTGSNTVIGHLAGALESAEQPPPLIRQMAAFARHLAVATLGIVAIIATFEIFRGAAPADVLLLAIALAVSAIPEGLPVSMTVALSIAMRRMGLRNVIVRHLPAVEGLGACTVIATDKTGTLTQNRLTVERLWTEAHGEVEAAGAAAGALLFAAAKASEPPAAGEFGDIGDAVDLAFFASASTLGPHYGPGAEPPAERIPYEPEKRFGAAFYQDGDEMTAYVKGAPETILSFCSGFAQEARAVAEQMSADGYRVIAVASGAVADMSEQALRGLRLLGFAGLIDPLRPEAKDAVAAAQGAGLRVAMVTGDHPLTAFAIAKQLGLASDRGEVVLGPDLARLEGLERDEAIGAARVFARTEPLQKLAIVESLRRQGHVVAVTGDGVNDAPAIHAADIGVAMGKDGTDLARDTADLILSDDNFASIVAGVEEGRVAYDNLRKVILLLLSTGAAEILLMLLSTVTGLPPPLSAVQLLWLNLVTNGLQDVALAFEKGEADVLRRKPRRANAPILDRAMLEQIALSGATIGLTAFAFYAVQIAAHMPHEVAQGATMWLLVWCENAHCFNSRSERISAFRIPLGNNPLLVASVVATQVLQIAVLAVPEMRSLLSLDGLTIEYGLSLAVLGLGVIVVMEIYKATGRPRKLAS